jgi:type I restriction enzyme S subunit
LGSILVERGETNQSGEVHQVLSVLRDVGVIPYEQKGNIGNKRSEDTKRYKVVWPDDIVVNCMNVIIGSVGRSQYKGCLSPVYYVLRTRSKCDAPRYYEAIFKTKPFHESLVRIGNGILAHRMRIPMELLKCERLPNPPLDDQLAIVRFLNSANVPLERTIRAKKKVIALLNEQKQTIIHRAVTRGLDPTVSFKLSGIPRPGDVPSHWDLRKLKYVSPHITVGIVIQPAKLYVASGVPCLRSLNISSGTVQEDALVFIGAESHRANRKSELHCGDIVVVRTGLAGKAVVVPRRYEGANCIDLLIIRKSAQFRSEFLATYLNSAVVKGLIEEHSVGAIQAHYNTHTLANLPIALPSLPEQDSILAHIRSECLPVDAAIGAAEREISLLVEYRTRIIADVVTGQLDVREASRTLPAEIDAPELSVEAAAADEPEELLEAVADHE